MTVAFLTKEQFNCEVKAGIRTAGDARHIIEGLVNWVIISLYAIDRKMVLKINERKLKGVGLANEPINWGDLWCGEVARKKNGKYVAFVEEANSAKLEKFIEGYLRAWGWSDVEIVTEW